MALIYLKKVQMLRTVIFSVCIVAMCNSLSAQVHPANDTLLPEQHINDTGLYEPKLPGGALIDTVNTKDTTAVRHRPVHPVDSTLYRPDSAKTRRKK